MSADFLRQLAQHLLSSSADKGKDSTAAVARTVAKEPPLIAANLLEQDASPRAGNPMATESPIDPSALPMPHTAPPTAMPPASMPQLAPQPQPQPPPTQLVNPAVLANPPGAYPPLAPGGLPTGPADPAASMSPADLMMAQQQQQAQLQMAQQGKLHDNLDTDRAGSDRLSQQAAATAQDSIAQDHAGREQQLQGSQNEAMAREAVNQEQMKVRDHQIEVIQQQAQAVKQLDDWHVTQEQNILAHQNEYRDKMLQLSNEHPENIWGNKNIAQKVTGIIGLVAGGFAGQDITQRVHNIASDAIAAQERKANLLGRADAANDNMAAQSERIFGSKKAAISNQYSSMFAVMSQQMEQAAARFSNPVAQAKLQEQAGLLKQQQAVFDQKTYQEAMTQQYKGLHERVQIDAIEAQRQGQVSASGAMSMKMLQGQVAGRKGFLDTASHGKFAPIEGGGHTLIEGLDRVEALGEEIQATPKTDVAKLAKLKAKYDAEKMGLLPAWREYTHSGARIEEGEQKMYNALVPSFLESGFSGNALGEVERLQESRDMIVNSLRRTGDSYGIGTSQFNEEFPLYKKSLARRETDKHHFSRVKDAKDVAAEAIRRYHDEHDVPFDKQYRSTQGGLN